jgi:hypothetical protein
MPLERKQKRAHNQDYYRNRTKLKRALDTAEQERKILVTFRLQESIVARLHRIKEEAITNGRYPWRTIGEVFRGVIIRGLESMKGDPIIDEGLPYLALVKQVDNMKQPRTEAEAMLHQSRVEIGRLLSIGEDGVALQFYHTTIATAEAMEPTVWRDWLLDELKSAFPELAKGKVAGVRVGGKAKAKATRVRGMRR